MVNPPTITPEQRTKALAKATAVRKARAELKADLASESVTFAELLDRTDDPLVAGMKVSAALAALPGIGKKRTAQIMSRVGVNPERRFRGVGSRQRVGLLRELL